MKIETDDDCCYAGCEVQFCPRKLRAEAKVEGV